MTWFDVERDNIRLYAAACNVDADDMRKDLQFSPDARKQFADWKALKNAA
jgi:hypothetical protein